MSEQDMITIRSWLRDRADVAPDPSPIVASVMADLDRVPQRRATLWRRPARTLGGSRLTLPWAPARRWATATMLLVLGLLLLVLVALLVANTVHRPPPLGGPFANIRSAAWSPDGKRLAFYLFDPIARVAPSGATQYDTPKTLYVMADDGSDLKSLATSIDTSPVPAVLWSPDGKWLLMLTVPVDPADPGLDVRSVASDGSETVDLGPFWETKWSPTANQVEGLTRSGDLVVVGADGSNRRVLASKANDATWSADGRYLLVWRGEYNGSDDSTIWLVPADGSDSTELKECSGPAGAGWSPTGGAIVCTRQNTTDQTIALATDGSPTTLTELDRVYGQVSPDGSSVVTRNLEPGIAIVHRDGSAVHITTDPNDAFPAFSSDGNFVSFWGNRPEGTGVFVVPSDGGPAKLIGRDASIQWAMDDPWQPDPSGPPRFVFIRGRSIVTVAADGSDPREILPEGAAASSRGDDPAADSVADRVVVLADGPDRAVYRIGPSPDAEFTVENRSDDPWVVGLWDDVGNGAIDCGTATPSSSVGGQVASIGPVVPPSRPALDMVPVTCEIAPHSSARIKDVGFVPRGTLEVNIYHVAAPGVGTLSRTIWLEFSPPETKGPG